MTLNLIEATLQEVVAALEANQLTSERLVKLYLERIDKDNIKGLGLRAVIQTAPIDQLIRTAKLLDAERAASKTRSVLHGVPVLVKDSISTHPSMGMQTTGGLLVLEGSTVKRNASIIDHLQEAGCIILGKANMTVLGNFYGTQPSGWSPRGGQTISFVKRDRGPSGSSSGSAVALSAGFCAFSIGGETCGSITSPAARAGLYGMKPTIGLVPVDECIGISSRVDCLGPMGKSAWDIAAILEKIVVPGRSFVAYTQKPYDRVSTSPIRLGIHRNHVKPEGSEDDEVTAELREEARHMFENALEKLMPMIKADPADTEDVNAMFQGPAASDKEGEKPSFLDGPNQILFEVEAFEAINEHLARIDNCPVKNLKDLVEWNEQHPELAFHSPGQPDQQKELVATLARGGIRDEVYHHALAIAERVGQNVEATFAQLDVDVLVFPAPFACLASSIASSVGFPVATIPIGTFSTGQPCAINLLALKGQDEHVIAAMAAWDSVHEA
ncbi:amidase signature domain-containing protein [Kockovaella imperatae]|uniref:Amidase signature domain-containing protein n=1 Tax=Kockovaella imperatae TaxID=4999 RepID=A0A1Y1UM45_9TREE|nr:amidase signature domain-containing protein [Kockovaella imperatae]ORX38205.1 amidase signature domain-containing protein [Kockovaella imperatae]